MNKKYKNKSGQALLIVLLAMAVIATVVLSISSRSISEVSITSREEESVRAFSAAEAGVEQALVSVSVAADLADLPDLTGQLNVTGSLGTPEKVSEYEAEVSAFPNNRNEFIYPLELLSGESAAVWLVTKDGDALLDCSSAAPCFQGDSIDLCWGEGGSTEPAAVEITFVYINASGDYASARAAYDPLTSRSGADGNNFGAPNAGSCTIEGKTFPHYTSIDLASLSVPQNSLASDDTKLMRVKMLYNTTQAQPFAVRSGGVEAFPTQGKKVTSEGSSGEATRKIDAFLLSPEMPHIFDSVVFSPVSITK